MEREPTVERPGVKFKEEFGAQFLPFIKKRFKGIDESEGDHEFELETFAYNLDMLTAFSLDQHPPEPPQLFMELLEDVPFTESSVSEFKATATAFVEHYPEAASLITPEVLKQCDRFILNLHAPDDRPEKDH